MSAQPNEVIATIDPVRLEIIRTGLQSIPDLIEADLMRTAFSPLVYEYKDYAVGLVDAEGRSISLARNGLPGFMTNVLGLAARDGIATYGMDRLEPGDVLISNYAGTMGQHLNNVIMYTPIFGAGARVVAFMAVNVHWIDIGGTYPGSCLGTDTTELIQEGLHLRSLKLYKRGELVEEVLRIIEYNTRLPEMLLGDIAAQYAGCIKGRQLFEQLMARHGEEPVFRAIETIWRNSEQAARAAVRKIPEGTYEAKSFLDNDGISLDQTIAVNIKVHIKDGDFIVDFSDCGAQVRGPFNSGAHGGGEACARIAFKYLFSPNELANEGGFAPVKVILPPGKFLSAVGNAPLGCYSTPLATVVDTIIAAMASVLPERVAGGHHASFGVFGFSGKQPHTGQVFNVFDTAHGGWGGSHHGDGVGPYKTIRHTDNKDIPIETVEALYPVMVEKYEWRADSAGAGRHRGGLGLDKTMRVLAPCTFNMAFERSKCPPWGLNGGLPGATGSGEVESADGRRETVHKARRQVNAGDRIHIHTGAGGGFGPPLERDPEAVRMDVFRGYVSREKAESIYGVIVTAAGELDVAATAKRRA
ncbi:MAG: hydantoinase B/oxoprolinase family protein [Betaproteobacteria bacterium]|nr:hydantoinase B/oxoprolinase family protein [Betaproteobacteria bacterium]